MNNVKAPGKLLKGYMSALSWINRILLICSGIAMVFITVIITADVAGRAFFKAPIQGTSEMVECVCSMIAFMGLGVCTMARQHIKVEFLVDRFPAKVQKVFNIFNYVIVIALTGFISVASINQCMKQFSTNARAYLTKFPYWPFYLLVALAFALMALNTLLLMIAEITGKEIEVK